MYLIDHPIPLGGPGHIMEINESKFIYCKYYCGFYQEGHWVLGMVECGTNNCVMVIVEDRLAENLLPIIQPTCSTRHLNHHRWLACLQPTAKP